MVELKTGLYNPMASRIILLTLLVLVVLLAVPMVLSEGADIEWEEESLFSPTGRASTPELVQVDEVLYLFWVEYGFNNDTLWFNKNLGEGWLVPTALVTMRADYTDVGYDVDADDGIVHLVYQTKEVNDFDVHYMSFNGTSWSSPLLLTVEKRVSNQTDPAIGVLGSQVHVAYEDDNPLDPGIYHRHFDGRSWTAAEELSTDLSDDDRAQFPQIAIMGKEVMVLWESLTAIRLVTYQGETWSKVVSVVPDHAIDFNNWPRLIAGDWGAIILYTEWIEGDHLVMLMLNHGTGWSEPETVNVTPIHYDARPAVSHERGNMVLAYTNMDTRMVVQRHDGRQWSPAEVLNMTKGDGQWMPHVLLSNGVAHLVFRHSDPGRADLKYYRGAIEAAPPTSLVAYDGPYWTDGGNVDLAWTLSDDFGIAGISLEYRHGTDNDTWSDWTVFASEEGLSGPDANGTVEFEPTDGDGFYQFRSVGTDVWGNVETPPTEADATAGLDTTAPAGSIEIRNRYDGGSEFTVSDVVNLSLTFDDATSGVAGIRLTNNGTWGDEAWRDPSTLVYWLLTPIEDLPSAETRAVRYQVMDAAGLVSETFSDEILYDLAPPTGSIVIEGGTERIPYLSVTLTLTYEDMGSGVDKVSFSHDMSFDVLVWEDPKDTRRWTLTGGDGVKTVYYLVVDRSGIISQTYSDTIILDQTDPFTHSVEPDGGDSEVEVNASITVRFSEHMDVSAAQSAFSLTWEDDEGGTNQVEGEFTWQQENRTMVFQPAEPLREGTSYRIVVGPDASDVAGNELYPDIDITFKTRQADEDGGDGEDGFPWGLVVALLVIICLMGAVIAFLLLRRRPEGA